MTPSFTVLFLPSGITARAPQDTTVLEAARACGLPLTADCGGNGICGKCIVEVLDGPMPGWHPACRLRVQGDMRIRIPQESVGQFLSDVTTTCALLCNDERLPRSANEPVYPMAAFDIGTTSLVCYLLDGRTGRELSVSSMLNPQTVFGADVITRIHHVLAHGENDLHTILIQAMNTLLANVCRMAAVSPVSVYLLAAAGNTCMHHLLLKLPLVTLATAPFQPALRHSLTLDAEALGLAAHPRAKLQVLPNIAGFVGADTVAGLIASSLADSDELMLLIDIGTNGEMVLGDKHGRTACSTAAGPAFEGSHIRCGMRGANGAIDHVRLHDGRMDYTAIGGGAPQGLCGSGLVDLVAVLLDAGVIDTGGRFAKVPKWEARMALADGQKVFRLDNKIFLTQKDVRELQLAKAAMAAGIKLLCAERGVSIIDIRKVAVAGAFGNYLDPRSACRIGLLPRELLNRIQSIGNAAGEGVKRVLRDPALWRQAEELAFGTRYLELAARADFQDCFVAELNFPETPI